MRLDITLQTVGFAAALLSAASWAMGAILYKIIGETTHSLALNLVKSVLSMVLLGAGVLVTGYTHVSPTNLSLLALSGVLGISVGDTLFFAALRNLSPQVLVLFTTFGQVLTVVFAVFFLGESQNIMVWLGIILIIAGIMTVIYEKAGKSDAGTTARGVMYGLLAVLCMSVAVIITKRGMSDMSVSAVEVTFIRVGAGVCGLLIWGSLTNRIISWVPLFVDVKLIKRIFIAVCVATFGGFWLLHVALKYIDVSIANTLNATEPLFVIPLAAIFLKERFSLRALVGALIACSGVIVISLW